MLFVCGFFFLLSGYFPCWLKNLASRCQTSTRLENEGCETEGITDSENIQTALSYSSSRYNHLHSLTTETMFKANVREKFLTGGTKSSDGNNRKLQVRCKQTDMWIIQHTDIRVVSGLFIHVLHIVEQGHKERQDKQKLLERRSVTNELLQTSSGLEIQSLKS